LTSFDEFTLAWIVLALLLFPIQLFVTAPYGRHMRSGWGPSIPNRLGWFIMEIVSLAVFAALFLTGTALKHAPAWIFFACWTAHYINRSLIFAWRTHTSGKSIPILIVLWAVIFNVVNAGLNGTALGSLYIYPDSWLTDPRFIAGLALFLIGAAINLASDNALLALRKHGGTGYAIPRGGMFEYISCPNLFGEIVQWFGFALMCWNLPALSFAIWTASNLLPRALSHHKWYRAHFADYPKARRALVPFLL
jgi:3-oxo-5-alpha-steroid 4-dehydrogenase 1